VTKVFITLIFLLAAVPIFFCYLEYVGVPSQPPTLSWSNPPSWARVIFLSLFFTFPPFLPQNRFSNFLRVCPSHKLTPLPPKALFCYTCVLSKLRIRRYFLSLPREQPFPCPRPPHCNPRLAIGFFKLFLWSSLTPFSPFGTRISPPPISPFSACPLPLPSSLSGCHGVHSCPTTSVPVPCAHHITFSPFPLK